MVTVGESQITKSGPFMVGPACERGCALLERPSAILLTVAEVYFYSSSYVRLSLNLDSGPTRGTWMR
jgi:hypothetical protein